MGEWGRGEGGGGVGHGTLCKCSISTALYFYRAFYSLLLIVLAKELKKYAH
jgi:hypothetical protein